MREKGDTQTLHEGKFISLVKKGKWEYAARKGVCGVVGILAVTDDENVVLVEQFRTPVGKSVIELPAGLAGDDAEVEFEELADAAHRELLEETGYKAAEMVLLAAGAASAGMTDEIVTLFRATGLKRVGAPEGDGSENITLHELPLAGLRTWLSRKAEEGLIIDLKVYSALYFLDARS